jgi:hypothetical protein
MNDLIRKIGSSAALCSIATFGATSILNAGLSRVFTMEELLKNSDKIALADWILRTVILFCGLVFLKQLGGNRIKIKHQLVLTSCIALIATIPNNTIIGIIAQFCSYLISALVTIPFSSVVSVKANGIKSDILDNNLH